MHLSCVRWSHWSGEFIEMTVFKVRVLKCLDVFDEFYSIIQIRLGKLDLENLLVYLSEACLLYFELR